MRIILAHYGVRHRTVNGKKPNSSYTKIPVLDINDRQINDSHIMVKNLAPVLDGKSLTPELIETEAFFTYKVMLSLEADTMESCGDLCGCGRLLGGCFGCLLSCFSCCLCCYLHGKLRKSKNLLSTEEYGVALGGKLNGKRFFHGEEMGIVDVSIFGGIKAFEEAGNSSFQTLMDSSPELKAWFESMQKSVSETVKDF
eukprot:CAMPEP_0197538428 /NCGR_PEP_ID=MMETSP1318-20131121/59655_1 /TAXON_ID=552666 /ORGANISM="Partenskyella glossopodia, Strain RCC365" /LENGTH=197 /DNA_ID=CAMNT_0043096835 /DNA_START=116 /DNA_END=709 /DNA_ORIENTATION=-